MTVPAMAAMDVSLAGSPVEGGEGVGESDSVGVVRVEEVEVEVKVADVDEGDALLRHAVISVVPTVLMSEHPPFRPWASNIMNIIEVPCATLASQLKLVGPTGGVKMIDVPPGTIAWNDSCQLGGLLSCHKHPHYNGDRLLCTYVASKIVWPEKETVLRSEIRWKNGNTSLHCSNAKFNWKLKSTPDRVRKGIRR
jgi:hypothetical protein